MARIRMCVDRGGTFTDVIAFVPNSYKEAGKPGFYTIVLKLLSVDSAYDDAPREGIRRILEMATGKKYPRNKPVPTQDIELIRMGTTVATNALLERKGQKTLLLITLGFKDLLKIGNQSRPNIFDLSVSTPEVLYERVIEIDERVTPAGYSSVPSGMNVIIPKDNAEQYKKGVTGQWIHVLRKPELDLLKDRLFQAKKDGFDSVAICLLHSYNYPEHEQQIASLCETIGFSNITMSSKTSPMVKIVPRGISTTADAYLSPVIQTYLDSFFSGFDSGISATKVEFMQSDGGLVSAKDFNGYKAILSGPAGGVVGYAATSWQTGGRACIGFDMGGTSTDVSRFGGNFEHVFESTTAGISIQAPQLDINTVAAGGGSRLFYRNGMFVVGPESAGAHPGPSCYRKGGPLSITDANLILGRLDPDSFPKIFGKNENLGLDIEASRRNFEKLSMEMQSDPSNSNKSIDEIAYGFVKVANEAMCRPIRALTQGKGFNASDHILSCFGGAGGQHAFAIARILGIDTVLVHKFAPILSAYGQALADVVKEVQEPCSIVYSPMNLPKVQKALSRLQKEAIGNLLQQGFPVENTSSELYLNMRYQGTDTAIMTMKPEKGWEFGTIFVTNYKKEFGFTLPDRDILIDDLRVRAIGRSIATGQDVKWTTVFDDLKTLKTKQATNPMRHLSIYWEESGRVMTPCYFLGSLSPGDVVKGPALLIDNTSTIGIEPGCSATITQEHVVGRVHSDSNQMVNGLEVKKDGILLSVFGHRFMSIAEQMGRTLQKTSISTNIKERLDFSCALFDQDGGLVANAPHIPVHLGSMQEAVKWQLNFQKGNLRNGDVLLSNHPSAGGSHLPDITVITPVFHNENIVFFVASRGHHADIGGRSADSKYLYEEGAAIKSFFLVRDGKFDEQGITNLLVDEPAKFSACTGTRCLKDNISDLKAQVAANTRGIQLVGSLISEYGIDVVQAYMKFIQQTASEAVSNMLKSKSALLGSTFQALEHMDDGSVINLKVSIDPHKGTSIFDFTGTSKEVYGNTNAPLSVTYSAVIYCLRCLIDVDIPLNQGALTPVKIIIPKGCFLNPSESAAVVGGNVLTSQRICDVILKAFQQCAASQGCCNNLTFGKDSSDFEDGFGYYETIAGGAGAGPSWNGCSGVHTHMTNTRITDPEILELRYPVILRKFLFAENTGGSGEFHGGDGVVREIEFLEKLQVSILSERRVFAPYGMHGGSDGRVGSNTIVRNNGMREINFGGKNTTSVAPGDRIRIETPGGGGYGKKGDLKKRQIEDKKEFIFIKKAGGSIQKYLDYQNAV